eukprot:TRINITY_DN4948_c1_g1_i1.p1 TRINITY_DN4948_c1_g1~~TRINITY_DN4948_c1_g1_i1.p1  ORF type:complete len:385 (-),score=72.16 TRINITY_DN4948_c1_g1_i1:92-1195(-)
MGPMQCSSKGSKRKARDCVQACACDRSAASPGSSADSPAAGARSTASSAAAAAASASESEEIQSTDASEWNGTCSDHHSTSSCNGPGSDGLSPNFVISAAEQGFFSAQGYLVKDKFFSEKDIADVKAEVERLQPQVLNSCVLAGKENMQLHNLSWKSDVFSWLPYNESVQNAVTALLGGPVEVYSDCQLFVKPARSGHGTAWHQDNAYFQEKDPSSGLGMWVALDDATEANGTLHVIPWTTRDGMCHHIRDDASDHMLTCREAVAAAGEVPCILGAGGVVFFRFDTPHCTKDNKTDLDRSAVAVHFRKMESDKTFRVERPLNLGLGLRCGEVYSMRDLVLRCDGDTDKLCRLIKHMLDPSTGGLALA